MKRALPWIAAVAGLLLLAWSVGLLYVQASVRRAVGRLREEHLLRTEPGSTRLTRMPSCRSSCISASLNALSPAFEAQYAAPPAKGFTLARLLTLMIQPPPRAFRGAIAAWQQ